MVTRQACFSLLHFVSHEEASTLCYSVQSQLILTAANVSLDDHMFTTEHPTAGAFAVVELFKNQLLSAISRC